MHAKVVKPIHAVNTACKAHNDDTHTIHEWKVYAILTVVKSSVQSYPVFSVWFLKRQLQLDVTAQFTKHFN